MTNWNNKEEVLEAVRKDGMSLEHASVELRADRQVVMAAVQRGYSLKDISEELRGDQEVVLETIDIRND